MVVIQEKIDLKKTHVGFRARRGDFRIFEMPPARYLAVDGSGDPNTAPEYRATLEALYPYAYALKFASRAELERDYVVPPLEGLWWADDMTAFTEHRDKALWRWTMMIMVPEWIPESLVEAARDRVKAAPERLGDVRLDALEEGTCVQTLHVGSFDDEAAVLARMHDEFIPASGHRMTGRHHEIYLGDPRRVAPERMRTILRQSVEPV